MATKKGKNSDLVSERLLELMARRSMTKAEMARALDVSNAHVANWLSGQLPRAEHLLTIATYFGVTMEWLLTGDQDHTSVVQEAEAIYRFNSLRDREIKSIADELEKLLHRLRALSVL